MKYMKLSILFFSLILIGVNQAQTCEYEENSCNSGPYLGIKSGITSIVFDSVISKSSWKPGYCLDGYFGYRFSSCYKLEGEISYQRAEIKHHCSFFPQRSYTNPKGHFNFFSYLANFIYEFKNSTLLKPYVGFGIGYADARSKWKSTNPFLWQDENFFCGDNLKYNDVKFCYKNEGVAWQSIIGINYRIVSSFDMGIDMRCLSLKNDILCFKLGLNLTKEF